MRTSKRWNEKFFTRATGAVQVPWGDYTFTPPPARFTHSMPVMHDVSAYQNDPQKIHTDTHFLHCSQRPFMCIIIHMDSREIIKKIKADGWYLVATKGSHQQFKHPTKPGRVTVPHPKRDLPLGTLRSVEKQSGVKLK